jgi:hypothetical protein
MRITEGPHSAGNRQNRVKIRIQGYDDAVFAQRESKDILVGGP